MDSSQKRRGIITDEAAEWLVELGEPTAQVKAEFADWLRASPEHVQEFLAVAALWDVIPGLPASTSVDEIVAAAMGESNVVRLETGGRNDDQSRVRRGRSRTWVGGIAASLLLAFTAAALFSTQLVDSGIDTFTTAVGEQRTVMLADGSSVMLTTQSTIRVDYTDQYRDIHLLDGEALFDVAKDPERPFRVMARDAVIQAVGTKFNVHQDEESVTVVVVEGIVDVVQTVGKLDEDRDTNGAGAIGTAPEPVQLTRGFQVRVESEIREIVPVEIEAEREVAWQHRRLIFDNWPLSDVIDEFNRYNEPPLMIDDAELAKMPFSGVFEYDDRDSFVDFLSQMEIATSHTRHDGTIALLPRDGR